MNSIQIGIIRELALRAPLSFAKLNADKLPSDQFSYHVRQLLKNGLIQKNEDGGYQLTVLGKSRRVLMVRNMSAFVSQGFIAVRIVLARWEGGQEQILIQERLTEPYKGTLATPGNKISYGEDIYEAAARIMEEQTGLSCTMHYRGLVHFKDKYKGDIVQDKYFFVLWATEPHGELKADIGTDKNLWLPYQELKASPLGVHGDMEIIDMARTGKPAFIERTFTVEEY